MSLTGIIDTMDNSWIAKALGPNFAGLNPSTNDKLLDEEVVILVQGKNNFGDAIYSYLKLSLRNLKKLKEHMNAGLQWSPSDFGTVVAAGRGEPNDEVRQEMAVTYQMVDVPKPKPAARSFTPPPRLWDED